MTSAVTLAKTAQRCALIHVVRQSPALGLDELLRLASEGQHSAVLSSIKISELLAGGDRGLPEALPGEPLARSVLRVFEDYPERRFASSTISRHFHLRRWNTQKVLAELLRRGVIVRAGRTSSTRYWLARN